MGAGDSFVAGLAHGGTTMWNRVETSIGRLRLVWRRLRERRVKWCAGESSDLERCTSRPVGVAEVEAVGAR